MGQVKYVMRGNEIFRGTSIGGAVTFSAERWTTQNREKQIRCKDSFFDSPAQNPGQSQAGKYRIPWP